MHNIREVTQYAFAAALSSGAIYSWLVINSSSVKFPLIWSTPLAISLFCALKCADLVFRMWAIAKYLRRIEEASFPDDARLPGWERYRQESGPKRYDRVSFASAIFAWAVMIGLCAATSCAFYHQSSGREHAGTETTSQGG